MLKSKNYCILENERIILDCCYQLEILIQTATVKYQLPFVFRVSVCHFFNQSKTKQERKCAALLSHDVQGRRNPEGRLSPPHFLSDQLSVRPNSVWISGTKIKV